MSGTRKTTYRRFRTTPELLQNLLMLPAGMKIRSADSSDGDLHFWVEHPDFTPRKLQDDKPPLIDVEYYEAGKCDTCNKPLAISINNFSGDGTNKVK